jgi:hypothetical protein
MVAEEGLTVQADGGRTRNKQSQNPHTLNPRMGTHAAPAD